ncbi:MAG: triphosphoribosyl-dephospho-CoA synthase [Gemmatales bacterium]|nr:triphosphoribosyl-dephospho-CoA synthase [Gemmatales bacterium]MDW8388159.1 triphosphoribosyl-dephospho-CoA synthase [Gemmatales bacterium]
MERPVTQSSDYSPALCAQLACVLEVLARKPGNVHRHRDFADASLTDFLLSAAVACPVFDHAPKSGVGKTVLEAVGRSLAVVRTNTHLGTFLLLAPLAAVPREQSFQEGLPLILHQLTLADSEAVFEAIRLARPGGLGRADAQDVSDRPSLPLREIMALAKERDMIARQYANGFAEVFGLGVPALLGYLSEERPLEEAIVGCFLRLLAEHPDTLITRKRGLHEAETASQMAKDILRQGWPDAGAAQEALVRFDAWLRADGHSRNPGTTADLVAACLFVVLREGTMQFPHPAGFFSGRIRLH